MAQKSAKEYSNRDEIIYDVSLSYEELVTLESSIGKKAYRPSYGLIG